MTDKRKKISRRDNVGAFSLGILCFQGFGLRIFDGIISGAIVIWLIVLALLNRKYLLRVKGRYWITVGLLLMFYVVFNTVKGASIQTWVLVAWLSAAVALTRYVNNIPRFAADLGKLSRFCMYYTLAHIPIAFFLSGLIIDTNLPMHPKTFMYLFWFNEVVSDFGMHRVQGFCWEPSCWNLLLNINLLFTLVNKDSRNILALSVIAILSIFSTTGMVCMIVVLGLYYMLSLDRKSMFKTVLTGGLMLALVSPFVYKEFMSKMESGSGQARGGDLAIAAAVCLNSPLLGEDLDNVTNLSYAINARDRYWTSSGDYEGYMEQGLVNAFAGLLVEWGIPLFLLIVFLFAKTPLFIDKKSRFLFCALMTCVLMGTPIARTGFFYMFPFSTLLLEKKKVGARKPVRRKMRPRRKIQTISYT